jgi:hypothetical protein
MEFAEIAVFHVVTNLRYSSLLGEAQLPDTRTIVKIDTALTVLFMRGNGKADQGSPFTRCSGLDIFETWTYSLAYSLPYSLIFSCMCLDISHRVMVGKLHPVLRKRQGSLTSSQIGVGQIEDFLLQHGADLASQSSLHRVYLWV